MQVGGRWVIQLGTARRQATHLAFVSCSLLFGLGALGGQGPEAAGEGKEALGQVPPPFLQRSQPVGQEQGCPCGKGRAVWQLASGARFTDQWHEIASTW